MSFSSYLGTPDAMPGNIVLGETPEGPAAPDFVFDLAIAEPLDDIESLDDAPLAFVAPTADVPLFTFREEDDLAVEDAEAGTLFIDLSGVVTVSEWIANAYPFEDLDPEPIWEPYFNDRYDQLSPQTIDNAGGTPPVENVLTLHYWDDLAEPDVWEADFYDRYVLFSAAAIPEYPVPHLFTATPGIFLAQAANVVPGLYAVFSTPFRFETTLEAQRGFWDDLDPPDVWEPFFNERYDLYSPALIAGAGPGPPPGPVRHGGPGLVHWNPTTPDRRDRLHQQQVANILNNLQGIGQLRYTDAGTWEISVPITDIQNLDPAHGIDVNVAMTELLNRILAAIKALNGTGV